jgi:hypothetical protein
VRSRPNTAYGRGTTRSATPSNAAASIAAATLSTSDTIQAVARFASSSRAGKPSVLMKPGSTQPTWTPSEACSARSASFHAIRAALLAE